MAKSSTRRVTIYIDGKEMEACSNFTMNEKVMGKHMLFYDYLFETAVADTHQINTFGGDGELACLLRIHSIKGNTFAKHVINFYAFSFRMANHNLIAVAINID